MADTILLSSFEEANVIDLLEPHDSVPSISEDHATHGDQCLKVVFGTSTYPNVWLRAGKTYQQSDWSEYGALLFDVHNPGEDTVQINVRIDDADEADGLVHCRQTGVPAPPGKTVTVCLAMPREELFMRAGPPAAAGDVTGSLGKGEIDLSHIIAFQFFLVNPVMETTLYIDNVRLAEARSFEKIVDRFGQYDHADWPGKLYEEAEFGERREAEREQLAAMPAPGNWDKWGGWADGPKLEATGWFRVAKHGGKWWLVTPDGALFWSAGLDCVGPGQRGPIKKRYDLFTYIPEPGDALYKFGSRESDWIDFYRMNLHRKYGEDYFGPFCDVTRSRMASWGFNTVANWADWECYKALRVPFTVPLHTGGGKTFPAAWKEIVDVYEDEWPQVARKNIQGGANVFRDDPCCIGYFVDNELPWGHWDGVARCELAIKALGLDGSYAVKRRFVELLADRYGDIGNLNAAWGTNADSWEKVRDEPVAIPNRYDERVQDDLAAMVGDFAERYFSVIGGLMKECAPNQLYLGARFCVATPEVLAAAVKHCDVVSWNIYGRAENFVAYAEHFRHIDKPSIIGEFHFGALDRGMFHTGLGPTSSQAERAAEYGRYMITALSRDWCVGAHWFQYIDEALTGRFDGENYNIGFVNVTDTPYPELVDQAQGVNRRMYEIRGE